MHLRSLRLKDVRCFEDARIDFSVPGDAPDGINILIGPNMSGKTTLLEAPLWALFGGGRPLNSRFYPRMPQRQEEIQRRSTAEYRWSIELLYQHHGIDYASTWRSDRPWDGDGTFMLAYGSGEPDERHADDPPLIVHYPVRCHLHSSLFEVPVAFEVEDDWRTFEPFTGAFAEDKFRTTLRLFQRYQRMAVPDGDGVREAPREAHPFDHGQLTHTLERFLDARLHTQGFESVVGSGVWRLDPGASVHGTPVHRPALSDGFISTLAVCIDLFIRLEKLPAKQKSAVVVLLDEVSGFLHPRWQVAFLPMLRELFPMAQFILTTHSPFVLASSPEGKLFAIERTRNESSVVDRSGDPLRLTIEQILNVFGVSRKAPRMAALEREFEECSGRIASGEGRPTDRARLRELTRQLATVDPVFRVLAESDRPSMALLDRLRRALGR